MPDISTPNEVDAYAYHLLPNTDYLASVSGASTGSDFGIPLSLPDPFVAVVDLSRQVPITFQDTNPQGGLDPSVSFRVPSQGDYIVGVADLTGGTGSYEVAVTEPSGLHLTGVPAGQFLFDPVSGSLTPI